MLVFHPSPQSKWNPPAWERFYPCQHKPQNSEPYIPIVRSEKVGIFTYKLHPSRGPLLVFGWNWNYDVWQNDSTQLIGLEGIIRFIRTHLLHLVVVVVFLGLAEFVCGTWLPCKEDHLWLFLMRTIFMLLIATSFAWKPRNRLMNDITFFFWCFPCYYSCSLMKSVTARCHHQIISARYHFKNCLFTCETLGSVICSLFILYLIHNTSKESLP